MSKNLNKLAPLYKKTADGGIMVWTIGVERTSQGTGVMVTEYGLQDGKKQTNREEIKEGKNAGKKNATSAYDQAVKEAEARWQKQRTRKGYGQCVGESAATRAISPMLAQVYEKQKKAVDWSFAFAQPKLDGFRCIARREGRTIRLTSRENQPLEAPVHVINALKKLLSEDIVLDGELYCHGMSLNQISSAVKRKSDLTLKLQYHLYDVMQPISFAERSKVLQEVYAGNTESQLQLVQTVLVQDEKDLMVCQQQFLEQGYEGAMLRHGEFDYEAGKRSKSLLKVKTFQDGEFKVIDARPGRGKYELCCVFVCETSDGHTFEVTSPGTLAEKQVYLANYQNYVGKMLTVKYAYLTKTDEPVPFQPVAKGFR